MALFARSSVASLLVGLAFLTPAQPGASQRDAPTARSAANYVRLDVFASRGQAPVADLAAVDFEVLEDNAPQQIESVERVSIAPAGPRARVFVLFLDAPHLSQAAAERLTGTVADQVDKVIAPDDLVAVMTPDMSAANLSFDTQNAQHPRHAREVLRAGRAIRSRERRLDRVGYGKCFPGATEEAVSPTAQEMIDRRRERQTVDALIDLIRHLTTSRDERKAMLVFSEGWPRLKPNASLVGRTEGIDRAAAARRARRPPHAQLQPARPELRAGLQVRGRPAAARAARQRSRVPVVDGRGQQRQRELLPIDPREVAAPRAKGRPRRPPPLLMPRAGSRASASSRPPPTAAR